jgi:aminotransferase
MESLPFSGIRVMMEKATRMEAAGEPVIHLELGRPDFDTPQVIKDAVYESIAGGNVFYTSNYGTQGLRSAIARKLQAENHVDYDPSEILVTVGVGEGTYCAFGAFLEPGDEVLIPDPVWLNYIHVPEYLGAKAVPYTLREENGYQIDFEELERNVSPHTKMLVIISPNNPTGSVLGRQTLEELAAFAIRHGLYVVADEIYEKLVYGGQEHISIASLPGMKERTITLNGFSKAYSMTGWRLGYMAAPREVIAGAVRLHQHINTCAPSFVQDAGVAALEKAAPDVEAMRREYERRMNYVVDAIGRIPGLSCHRPEGAFYVMVNVKQLGKSAAFLADHYLDQAKLAMVPGTAFGGAGEGYLRLSYANNYENLVEACGRLAEATEKLVR